MVVSVSVRGCGPTSLPLGLVAFGCVNRLKETLGIGERGVYDVVVTFVLDTPDGATVCSLVAGQRRKADTLGTG